MATRVARTYWAKINARQPPRGQDRRLPVLTPPCSRAACDHDHSTLISRSAISAVELSSPMPKSAKRRCPRPSQPPPAPRHGAPLPASIAYMHRRLPREALRSTRNLVPKPTPRQEVTRLAPHSMPAFHHAPCSNSGPNCTAPTVVWRSRSGCETSTDQLPSTAQAAEHKPPKP